MIEKELCKNLTVKTIIDNRLSQLTATAYNIPIVGGYYFQILKTVFDYENPDMLNSLKTLKVYVGYLKDYLFNELYIPIDYQSEIYYNLVYIGAGYKTDKVLDTVSDKLDVQGYSLDFVSNYMNIVTTSFIWYTSSPVTQFNGWIESIDKCIKLLEDVNG